MFLDQQIIEHGLGVDLRFFYCKEFPNRVSIGDVSFDLGSNRSSGGLSDLIGFVTFFDACGHNQDGWLVSPSCNDHRFGGDWSVAG